MSYPSDDQFEAARTRRAPPQRQEPLLYLIGSLRNPEVPKIANTIRTEAGVEVFDDWYAAGERADDAWKAYEQARGHDYITALKGHAANHVFEYDAFNLNRATMGLLVLPAGRSGHIEFGILRGQGKPGWILLDDADARWDVMYKFASGIVTSVEEAITRIKLLA